MDVSSITNWLLSIGSWIVGIIFLLVIIVLSYYLMNWIEGISSRDEIRALRQDIKNEFENLRNKMTSDVGFLDERNYCLDRSRVHRGVSATTDGKGLFDLSKDMNDIRTEQLDEYLTKIAGQIKMTNDKLDRIIEELERINKV